VRAETHQTARSRIDFSAEAANSRFPSLAVGKDLEHQATRAARYIAIERRTDVVGVFADPAALLRLAGSVLVEAHCEWHVADKHYLSEITLGILNFVANPDQQSVARECSNTAIRPPSLWSADQGRRRDEFIGGTRPATSGSRN
jgi:hypothetical protein